MNSMLLVQCAQWPPSVVMFPQRFLSSIEVFHVVLEVTHFFTNQTRDSNIVKWFGVILLPADRHFGGNYVGYRAQFLQVYNFDWTMLSHKKKGCIRLYWSPRGWVSNLLFTSLWKKNSLAISVYCCRHVRWRMAKTPPDEVGDIVRTNAGRGGGLLPWRQMYSDKHEEWRWSGGRCRWCRWCRWCRLSPWEERATGTWCKRDLVHFFLCLHKLHFPISTFCNEPKRSVPLL